MNHSAREVHRRTFGRGLRDLLFYVAIALLLVGLLLLYALHQVSLGQTAGLPTKWVGYSIMTVLIFLNALRSHRSSWGEARFWILLAPFSALHFGVGIFVVSRLGKVGLIDFAVATLFEYFALSSYLNDFLPRKRTGRPGGSDR